MNTPFPFRSLSILRSIVLLLQGRMRTGMLDRLSHLPSDVTENCESISSLKVNAPKLKVLSYKNPFLDDFCLENTLNLREVNIVVDCTDEESSRSSSNLVKFFVQLPCIENPQIRSYFLKAPKDEQYLEGEVFPLLHDDVIFLFPEMRCVKIHNIADIEVELDFTRVLLSSSPVLERITIVTVPYRPRGSSLHDS